MLRAMNEAHLNFVVDVMLVIKISHKVFSLLI